MKRRGYTHWFEVARVIHASMKQMTGKTYREGVERAAALNACANEYLGESAIISSMEAAFYEHECRSEVMDCAGDPNWLLTITAEGNA